MTRVRRGLPTLLSAALVASSLTSVALVAAASPAAAADPPDALTTVCSTGESGAWVEPAAPVTAELHAQSDTIGYSKPAGQNPKYETDTSGSVPGSLSLHVKRLSDGHDFGAFSSDTVDSGFSPDEDDFLTVSRVSGSETVRVYNLASTTPTTPVVQITDPDHDLLFGWSPSGSYFFVAGYQQGSQTDVNLAIYDAKTHRDAPLFSQPVTHALSGGTGESGDAGEAGGDTSGTDGHDDGFHEAGWGFAPGDDGFVYATQLATSDQYRDVTVALVNLAGADASNPVFQTPVGGSAYWQFSPQGAMFGWVNQVAQSGNGALQFDLVDVASGDALLPATGAYDAVYPLSFDTEADGVHDTFGDGTPQNTSTHHLIAFGGTDCPSDPGGPPAEPGAPSWPDDATLGWVNAADDPSLLAGDNSTGIRLSWPAASAAQGRTLEAYRVYQDDELIATVPATAARSYTVTGLSPGERHLFQVQAVDDAATESADGPQVHAAAAGLQHTDTSSLSGHLYRDLSANPLGADIPSLTTPVCINDTGSAVSWTTVTLERVDPSTGAVLAEIPVRNADGIGQCGDGLWEADDLVPGRYAVVVDDFWLGAAGSPTSQRRFVTPGGSEPYLVTVTADEGWAGLDVGLDDSDYPWIAPTLFPNGPASLDVAAFDDENRNGVHDAGEPSVAGIPFQCGGYGIRTAYQPGVPGCGGVSGDTVTGLLAAPVTIEPQLWSFQPAIVGGTYWYPSPHQDYLGVAGGSLHPDIAVVKGSSSISGTVFWDKNDDGIAQAGETLAAAQAQFGDHAPWAGVRLVDPSGLVDMPCDVDDAGTWTCDHLPPGTYWIEPNGGANWFATQGGGDGLEVTITGEDQAITGRTVGIDAHLARLTGTVFLDDDQDGVRDTGEPGAQLTALRADGAQIEGDPPLVPVAADGTFDLWVPSDRPITLSVGDSGVQTDAGWLPVVPETVAPTTLAKGQTVELDVGLVGLSAPSGITAAGNEDGSLDLDWTAPPPVAGHPLIGYYVSYQGPDAGADTVYDGLRVDSTTLPLHIPYTELAAYPIGLPQFVSVTAIYGTDASDDELWGASSELAAVVWADGTGAGPDPTPTPTAPAPSDSPTPSGSPSPSPSASAPAPTVQPPSAPRSLAATAGAARVSLHWKAPSSTGGATVTGYQVFRSGDHRSFTRIATVAGTKTSYAATRLANGKKYWFRVVAVNAGGSSLASGAVAATPFTKPSAPRSLTATAKSKAVALKWKAPKSTGGATVKGYRVYRSGDGRHFTLAATVSKPAYTAKRLVSGKKYWFRVTAVNKAGPSAATPAKRVTPR